MREIANLDWLSNLMITVSVRWLLDAAPEELPNPARKRMLTLPELVE